MYREELVKVPVFKYHKSPHPQVVYKQPIFLLSPDPNGDDQILGGDSIYRLLTCEFVLKHTVSCPTHHPNPGSQESKSGYSSTPPSPDRHSRPLPLPDYRRKCEERTGEAEKSRGEVRENRRNVFTKLPMEVG